SAGTERLTPLTLRLMAKLGVSRSAPARITGASRHSSLERIYSAPMRARRRAPVRNGGMRLRSRRKPAEPPPPPHLPPPPAPASRRPRPRAGTNPGAVPRRNRRAHPCHQLLVIGEIDRREQDRAEHFVGSDEMMQIGAREIARRCAGSRRVDRARILRVARVL